MSFEISGIKFKINITFVALVAFASAFDNTGYVITALGAALDRKSTRLNSSHT